MTKKSQWCLKTIQPATLNKRVLSWKKNTGTSKSVEQLSGELELSRGEVLNTGKCGNVTRRTSLSTPMPLQITSREKNGDLTVRGSMTLFPNGEVKIGAIKPISVNMQALRQAAANDVFKTHKNVKSAAFRKAFIAKVKSLYNTKMKKELTYDRLRQFDLSKGSLSMHFKEYKSGHRTSTITTHDAKGKHLRSLQMNPINVLGQDLSKAWCSGENCLLISRKRRKQIGLDSMASCGRLQSSHLDMAGGNNACMSCYGITPGVCKTTIEAIDNGFDLSQDPNRTDRLIGKFDPIEAIVKKQVAKTKERQCQRQPAPLPKVNADIIEKTIDPIVHTRVDQ